MKFYLGTHEPAWLDRTSVPLCVSRRRLARRVTLPASTTEWVCDSSGFTELDRHGRWTVPAEQYAAEVRHYIREIPGMRWAAIQDWMCEPHILAKTGKAIVDHQRLTVRSHLELMGLAPEIPWLPVLQGFDRRDYLAHLAMYRSVGIDLTRSPIVGVGSVCRRQSTEEAGRIFEAIAGRGVKIHGFGVKTKGLGRYARALESTDSMAWSSHARRRPPLEGCSHKSCANCQRYAMAWRSRMLEGLTGGRT